VVVVVHGGYWRARYDRSLMTDLCVDLAEHGVAAWNIEYRRVGSGGGWPQTFFDVAAATDLLASIDVPLDLSRAVGVGHSAGGHLAFWVAARPTLPPGVPGSGPRVRLAAVASQAGVLDLRLASELTPSDEPTRALLGTPEQHPEVYDLASPLQRLPLGIPQLVLHGERDTTVALEISRSYADAARAAGDPCELHVLCDTGHFEHIDARSDAWRMARDWLLGYAMADRS
jgi:acetyl esterase/lipase